jgi:GDP-L-fucose synthase
MILVTGGNGFIGNNLISDVKLSRSDADLTDYEATLNIFSKYRPSTVIHTAARHGNFVDMSKCNVDYIQDNLRIDLNVIKACKEIGVKNLLMISSITSFPENTDLPYKEINFFNGNVSENHYGYSFSKKISISLCHAYQKDFNLNYKSVILGNVYGPKNHFHENGTVISKLIHDCYIAKETNTDFIVYGDGSPVRDFLYVEDLNAIFKHIIDSGHRYPIIVSSGNLINIKTLVNLIAMNIGYTGNIIWGNQSNMGQIEKYSDITELRKILPNYTFTDIEDGIKKTCQWYIKNHR